MWFVLSITAGLLFAINKIMFRKVFVGDVNPIAFFSIHDLLAGLMLVPIAAYYFSYPATIAGWIYLVLAIILLFSADLFAALSLNRTEASQYQIAVQIRNIVTLIGGFIFFSEAITYLKVLSIVLIFLGVFVAMKINRKVKIDKGILYAFMSGVSIAVAFLFVKEVSQDMKPEMIASLGLMGSGVLGLLTFKLRSQRVHISNLKPHIKPLVIAALIFAMFELVQFQALHLGQASKVTPASQSSMIFTLIGGYIFLNERSMLKRKIIGSLIIVVGISLLIV
jgi:drug/metabolite transporter (DMT)-like permease